VVYVAAQAGHAPTITLDTYAHVIAELEGGERLSAERLIREARGENLPIICPRPARALRRRTRQVRRLQVKREKPSNGLEPLTPSLPCKFQEGAEGSSVPSWVDNPWSRPL
jgi:hypothetical protein